MKKYKLLRTWIDKKRGNPYFPDEYLESQLPENIRNDRYWCLPLDEIEISYKTKPKDESIIDLRVNNTEKEISVTKQEILGSNRSREFLVPRQIAMWFAKKKLRETYQKIGSYFGGRDHTSVINSIKKVEKFKKIDPEFFRNVNKIKNDLGF